MQPEPTELEQQDAASARSGPSLIQVAWQRKSLVILGVMLGLVLGTLYYAQREKIYESRSQMLVVKKTAGNELQMNNNGGPAVGYIEDYMSTQSIIIRSPEIIGRAIKLPILQDLSKSFPSDQPEDLVYSLQGAIQVVRDNRDTVGTASNNILTLAFRGPNSDDCKKILQAIIDSYQAFLNETYKNVSEKTVDLINSAREMLNVQLEQDNQRFADFRKNNPFLFFKGNSGNTNMFADRMARTEQKRHEYLLQKAELDEQLSQIEKALKEGGKQAAMNKIAATNLQSKLIETVGSIDKDIALLEVKRNSLLNSFGPSHPLVQEVDLQIKAFRHIAGRGFGGALDTTAKPDAKPVGEQVKVDPVDQVIQATREKIDGLAMILNTLENQFAKDQNAARELFIYEAEEDQHKTRIAAKRQLFENINKRLQEINLVRDFGGYEAKVLAPPAPGRKVSPNAYSVFPVAAIAGLLAGLCLAYLAELSDKSFRTPAEIRRRLGLPVIGHIPYFAADEKAQKAIAGGEAVIDPMICTHYASNSVSSEAYRSVRTSLYFNTQGIGHQVIQVTSPNMADGKSTLAANLAVSIAQSGKKTIIIDADCRRPRVHKIFAVPHDTGLASVIAGQADLTSAIKPTAVPNLSALPCGPRPANPAELLTSPRFKELLDIIRAQYDYVIVDTPPLLVVTDPCVVAPRVDGVVMAIRVTKNGRPFAERAKEILASLGANCLGVVVNGLGAQAGGRYGYGYDSYNYGYGYTYRYSYTYVDDYTDDKASSYYSAPDSPEMPPAPPAPPEPPAAR